MEMCKVNRCVVVLDTNIVLDLYVFKDRSQNELLDAITTGRYQWLTTESMLNELRLVLQRSHLEKWLCTAQLQPDSCWDEIARWAMVVDDAPGCSWQCSDPDDQGFIDLAVQRKACLLSKDKAVLRLAASLARNGIGVGPTLDVVRHRVALG